MPLALLLRHAAGDGDDRPRALLDGHLTKLAETREEFFLGALAHAAGVDDDDVCVAIVGRGLVARLLEQSGHALGVVHVHLTAVRFDQVFSRHAFAFAFRFFSLSPCRLYTLRYLATLWSRFFCMPCVSRRDRQAPGAPRREHLTGAGQHGGDTAAPPIIRASSASRSARAEPRATAVTVRPAFTDLLIR